MLIEANRTLRVLDARFVHDAFEPKLAATQRTYLYRFQCKFNRSNHFIHGIVVLLDQIRPATVMERPLSTLSLITDFFRSSSKGDLIST